MDVVGLGIFRWSGGCVCVIRVIATVGFFVQTTDTSRLFMTIGTHVSIIVVLLPAGLAALAGSLSFLEEQRLSLSLLFNLAGGNNAATAQFSGFGSIAEGCAIRTFSSENGGFIFFPVALLEMDTAILGPEEEPDTGEDQTGGQECKESEDPAVIDVVRVVRAFPYGCFSFWFRRRAYVKVGIDFDGG